MMSEVAWNAAARLNIDSRNMTCDTRTQDNNDIPDGHLKLEAIVLKGTFSIKALLLSREAAMWGLWPLNSQSDICCMDHCLPFGEQLCENVCCHVFSGTVDCGDGMLGNGLSNEMISDVNVFCSSVVIMKHTIATVYYPTEDRTADILTKFLPKWKTAIVTGMRERMGWCPLDRGKFMNRLCSVVCSMPHYV
jgi:hypothetical protein